MLLRRRVARQLALAAHVVALQPQLLRPPQRLFLLSLPPLKRLRSQGLALQTPLHSLRSLVGLQEAPPCLCRREAQPAPALMDLISMLRNQELELDINYIYKNMISDMLLFILHLKSIYVEAFSPHFEPVAPGVTSPLHSALGPSPGCRTQWSPPPSARC